MARRSATLAQISPKARRSSRSLPRSSPQRALSLVSLSCLQKRQRRLPPHPPPLRRLLLLPAAPLRQGHMLRATAVPRQGELAAGRPPPCRSTTAAARHRARPGPGWTWMRARSSSSPSDLRRPVALAAPPSVDRTCTSTKRQAKLFNV